MLGARMGVSRHVWPVQVSADSINDISAYASDQDKFSPGMPNDLLPINCIARVRTLRTAFRSSQHAHGPVLSFTPYNNERRRQISAILRGYANT